MHLFYMLTLSIYINNNFCIEHESHQDGEKEVFFYNFLLAVGILYPFVYDNI